MNLNRQQKNAQMSRVCFYTQIDRPGNVLGAKIQNSLTVAVPEIWDILEIQSILVKKCAHIFEVPITFLELF